MQRESYLDPYIDAAGEHRLRTRAGNHEILMVLSEGIQSEDDVLVAAELSRQALNDARANDADHRRRTDAAMARRARGLLGKTLANALLRDALFGGVAPEMSNDALLALRDIPAPQSRLAKALSGT